MLQKGGRFGVQGQFSVGAWPGQRYGALGVETTAADGSLRYFLHVCFSSYLQSAF